MSKKTIKKHSITINGTKTSITIELEFWEMLQIISHESGISINQLIQRIDETKEYNLSSSIRVFVLNWIAGNKPHGG